MTQLIINIEDTSKVTNIKKMLAHLKGVTITSVTTKKEQSKVEQKAFNRAESFMKLRDKIRCQLPENGIDDETIRQECEAVRQELYEKRVASEQ